jgi:hypothetical protein
MLSVTANPFASARLALPLESQEKASLTLGTRAWWPTQEDMVMRGSRGRVVAVGG